MRLVGAGSELLARAAPADELGGCCGRLGRVAACMTSLHHSWLALEPSMALGSFSLSLLIQVHEAAAVVASGGDAGDDGGDGGVTQRTTTTRTRVSGEARGRLADGCVGLLPCLPVKRATLRGGSKTRRAPA